MTHAWDTTKDVLKTIFGAIIRGQAMNPDDRRWLWVVYATVFVPLVGRPLLVFGSSAFYFRWRHDWPKAAARLNRHAWTAVALNIALTLGARHLLRR